jgi:hypothetical protein
MLEEFNAAVSARPARTTISEREFCQAWVTLLSHTMLKTGKGFRVDSPLRRPSKGASHWRGERRADKEHTTKLSRRLEGMR